jgi:Acetyltransferase (GNAT) domain
MPVLPDSLTLREGALELRRLEPSDRDAVFRACQDAELLRWTTLPDPYTEEDADRLVDEVRAQWEEGRGAELAITVDGELVGSIHLVFHGDWRASVACWLAAEARGRGYATDPFARLPAGDSRRSPVSSASSSGASSATRRRTPSRGGRDSSRKACFARACATAAGIATSGASRSSAVTTASDGEAGLIARPPIECRLDRRSTLSS